MLMSRRLPTQIHAPVFFTQQHAGKRALRDIRDTRWRRAAGVELAGCLVNWTDCGDDHSLSPFVIRSFVAVQRQLIKNKPQHVIMFTLHAWHNSSVGR